MSLVLWALGGMVIGVVLNRLGKDLPTRLILNATIFALLVAQIVLSVLKAQTLPAETMAVVFVVLWGLDLVASQRDRYY